MWTNPNKIPKFLYLSENDKRFLELKATFDQAKNLGYNLENIHSSFYDENTKEIFEIRYDYKGFRIFYDNKDYYEAERKFFEEEDLKRQKEAENFRLKREQENKKKIYEEELHKEEKERQLLKQLKEKYEKSCN